MSFNSRDFRNCLGTFATGVTVATTLDGEKPCGVTINSFSSLSLKPPLVLFCLAKDAYYYQAFTKAKYFGVNILSESQQFISESFARSAGQPWDEVTFTSAKNGSPYFSGAHGFMECELHAVHDGGDHSIIVGKVLHVEHDETCYPLLYYRGGYRTIGHQLKEDLS